MTSDTEYKLTALAVMLNIEPAEFLDLFKEIDMTTMTRGPRAGSFNAQVIELQPGESVSKVRAVDPTTPVMRLPDELPAIRQQVRNACAPAVTKAKEMNKGAVYTVEVGDCVMPNGSFYVVAVVSRTV